MKLQIFVVAKCLRMPLAVFIFRLLVLYPAAQSQPENCHPDYSHSGNSNLREFPSGQFLPARKTAVQIIPT